MLVLLVCFGLAAMAARPETIFTAQYATGQSASLSASLQFNSASLISVIGLSLLFIDATRTRGDTAKLKKLLFALASVIIIVYFQILRGDRDGFTFILAIAALYIVGPQAEHLDTVQRRAKLNRFLKIFLPLILLALFGIVLGILRPS